MRHKARWALDGPVNVTCNMSQDMKQQLIALAETKGMSLSRYVRRVLRRHLKEQPRAPRVPRPQSFVDHDDE